MGKIIAILVLTTAWMFSGSAAAASTLEQEKERLSAEAVQLMIAELGLRASGTPSRELPGWGKVTKMVARYPAERIAELQILAPGAEIKVDAFSDGQEVIYQHHLIEITERSE